MSGALPDESRSVAHVAHDIGPAASGGTSGWPMGSVIPNERMEYTQNMCDREGNLIEPTSIGMPAEFPRDVATVVTLAPRDGKTEMTIVEHTTTTQALMDGSHQGLELVIDQMGATFG